MYLTKNLYLFLSLVCSSFLLFDVPLFNTKMYFIATKRKMKARNDRLLNPIVQNQPKKDKYCLLQRNLDFALHVQLLPPPYGVVQFLMLCSVWRHLQQVCCLAILERITYLVDLNLMLLLEGHPPTLEPFVLALLNTSTLTRSVLGLTKCVIEHISLVGCAAFSPRHQNLSLIL